MSVDSESSQKTSLAALFTPYALNGLMLPNRLVMAPMTRGFATAGVPSENAVSYYARRAGMGLILTEGVAPDLIGSPETTVPNMFGAEALSVWARIVSAVHASGGRIMAQLWHTGLRRKVAKSFDPSQPSLGPSDYYPELDPARRNEPNRAVSGRAMSQQDIDATIRSYASAAKAARDLGFDGVELHGAHGYMLDQFFWAECNRRNDRYGGSLGNRVRLATEIISEIKRVAGRDFPVGLRFSQWKLPDFYDARMFESPKELEEFLTPFVDVGTDFFHASTRRYWDAAFPSSPLTLAGWTRRITATTTIAVGSVGLSGPMAATAIGTEVATQDNVAPLCRLVEEGEFDLVAVGRAVLADAQWAEKVRNGNFSTINQYTAAALGQLT